MARPGGAGHSSCETQVPHHKMTPNLKHMADTQPTAGHAAASDVLETLDIAVIAGDGIGPEVVAEGLKALHAVTSDAGPKVSTTEYDLGARRWHATGETLPDSVLEDLRGHDAILLGAVG